MLILKRHNEKAVQELTELYRTKRTLSYISGVGTGKSFVFMGLAIRTFPKARILYVLPKYSVGENLDRYPEFGEIRNRVDFATYNYFTSREKGMEAFDSHDLVVIDECHHMGSDIYGQVLAGCVRGSKAFVLGMTATPVRDMDGTDVRTYFEGTVTGITNFEAIEQGLMPAIEYRICFPEKDPRQLEREYEGAVRAVLSYELSEDTLREAVSMFPKRKWICFFSSLQDIRGCESMIGRIFPDHELLVLHSSLDNLSEVMDSVRNADCAVVLSCNMLLEGVHLEGIDGIILFRNVSSLSCFQQMVGRVCSIGKKTEPVVLDCTASARALLAKLFRAEEEGTAGASPLRELVEKEVIKIGIGSQTHFDIRELLRLIGADTLVRDAKAEDAVRKYREFHGGEGYSDIDELKKNRLDYRKLRACCKMYGVSIDRAFGLMREALA